MRRRILKKKSPKNSYLEKFKNKKENFQEQKVKNKKIEK